MYYFLGVFSIQGFLVGSHCCQMFGFTNYVWYLFKFVSSPKLKNLVGIRVQKSRRQKSHIHNLQGDPAKCAQE